MTDMITVKCSGCGHLGPREEFRVVSDSPFCENCIHEYQAKGWVKPSSEHANIYVLTPIGEKHLPGLVRVAVCPRDGMPIYQRWVIAGIARAGDKPACPYCLGKD